jgi:hypothetical protein
VPPATRLEAVRGLDDAHVAALGAALHVRAASAAAAGDPHLYDLFEVRRVRLLVPMPAVLSARARARAWLQLAQEELDHAAVPRGTCPICLRSLAPATAAAPVERTGCYHLFHTACLLGSIRYQREREEERQAVARARGHVRPDAAQPDLADMLGCPLCRVRLAAAVVRRIEVCGRRRRVHCTVRTLS